MAWAAFLAFLLYPLNIRLRRRLKGRAAAAGLLTFLAPITILLPLSALSIDFVAQISTLLQKLQKSAAELDIQSLSDLQQFPWIARVNGWLEAHSGISAEQIQSWLIAGTREVLKRAASTGGGFFLGALGSLFGFAIMLFLLFFFLRDGDAMLVRARNLIPLDDIRKERLFRQLSGVTRAIVIGTSVTAFFQGVLVGIGFTITGLPSPVVFGVLAALLAMLPVGGTALVWGPAVIWLFFDGRWGYGIFLLVWGLLLGGLDNVLRPPAHFGPGKDFRAGRVHRRSGRHTGVRRHRAHCRAGAALPGAGLDRIRRREPIAGYLSRPPHARNAGTVSRPKLGGPSSSTIRALMDVSHLLEGLNDDQRQAVTSPLGAALVLAGAGSGKTRVLVHRVAWLIQVEGASPNSILAVTFTNKAAAEMRSRIETLLGLPSGAMWLGTFHGLAHRLLRIHWREAGLPQSFQILDSEDQARVLRKVLKALDLDETRWIPREILWFINAQKDEGHRPKHIKDDGDPTRRQLIKIYQAYEEACQRAGVLDFAELLLRAYELWRDNPSLLLHYRTRFRHVLVDEFQDTNAIQYKWLMLLAGPEGQPFVVGDDDQSIYRWRGARVENLNQFRRDFPKATLYKLEQNYRSTGTILKAANALISNNAGRLGKTLWTSGADGERVKLYAAFNERDEADFVVNRIREWVAHGGARREAAVLYRSNAQSRVFEEAFLNARMPYRVYGGLRFFERAEIKDTLAYLRLVASRADDTSFERIVNLPVRGIGAKTMDTVRDHARAHSTSLWMGALSCIQGELPQRAALALQAFLALIDKLAREVQGLELHEQVDHVIQMSGLIEHFKKEKGERGEGRVENLLELVSAARGFSPETDAEKRIVAARILSRARRPGIRRGAGRPLR